MKRSIVLLFCLSLVLGKSIFRTSSNLPQSFQRDSRILNGKNAHLGQFPWQVFTLSVELVGDDEIELRYCNGAILNEEWIITTAHCIDHANDVWVSTGNVNASSNEALRLPLDSTIIHDEYNASAFRNDIGLIKVATPIVFDENIKAIALSDEELGAGVVATVSGWGSTDSDDENGRAQILQYGNVTTMDNADCQNIYGTDFITPSLVCTSIDASAQSPCFNDAGAPVVVDADSDPVLVAILNFLGGYHCEYPPGYARIAYYRDWIREKTGI